ncbi:MAG: hypothetical protein ACJAS1_000924 [Oleiphilaceae bacterium]|jgi:hypothetical protein
MNSIHVSYYLFKSFQSLTLTLQSVFIRAEFSSLFMHTETVTFLKENTNKLNVNETLVVTQNGKAKYVIQSFE